MTNAQAQMTNANAQAQMSNVVIASFIGHLSLDIGHFFAPFPLPPVHFSHAAIQGPCDLHS